MSDTISESSDTQGVALVAALKAARAALGWGQQELAKASGVSKVTIARMETGMMSPRLSTLSALLAAVEKAGIQLTLNAPAGGFSMTVEQRALTQPRDSPAAAHPPKTQEPAAEPKRAGPPQVGS